MSMLVLTRRKGESVLIGDKVEITIVEIQGDKIKIGVSAPKKIEVLRKELVSQAKDANKEAAFAEVGLDILGKAVKKKEI